MCLDNCTICNSEIKEGEEYIALTHNKEFYYYDDELEDYAISTIESISLVSLCKKCSENFNLDAFASLYKDSVIDTPYENKDSDSNIY